MYAAQAAKKAAEAKKAADVRRKLLRASASIDGESSAFVSFVSGEGKDGGSQHGNQQGPETGEEYSFAAPSTRAVTIGRSATEAVADPLSIWA
jgi:hypothetical protein